MPDVVDRLGVGLLDASLAAIAISGLVVLAMVQCRQPARRRGWARAGLISTLLLLPLSALNPVPRFDVRGPLRSLLPTALDEPPPRHTHSPESRYSSPCIGGIGSAEPACGRPFGGVGPPPGPLWPRWIARGTVLGYGAGASIGLASILLGTWGSARLVRRGWPPSEESLGQFESLPFEGRSTRPGLLVSNRVNRAVLVGSLRPMILIPANLDEPKSADRLRLSLLHELAHAEGGDHWFGPAATLARAIWFFLPPVWWIRHQMKLDQEFLADRRAVTHFGTSGGYASSLIDLAASLPTDLAKRASSPTETPQKAGPGVASALFQRVMMLVKCPFAIEGQTPIWWRWSTALTIGLITLAASCLTLRGLAGASNSSSSRVASAEVARSIRLPQLAITRRENDDQPFDLRFRLPEQFSLTFEIMAEPADLSTLEVLGHPLGSRADLDPPRQVYRLWHRVQIRRVGNREFVLVDDRPVNPEVKPTKLASWLTIRPLRGQTTRLRELELSW